MNNFLKDLQADDDSDEGANTLFEDNFEQMVENEQVENLNPQTIKDQIGQVGSQELLAQATKVDSRDEMAEVYQDRIAELNADDKDDAQETGQGGGDGDEERDEEAADGVDDVGGAEDGPDDAGPDATDDGVESDEDGDEAVHVGGDEEESPEGDGVNDGGEEEVEEQTEPEVAEGSDLPEVNVSALAPDASTIDEAAQREKKHSVLVWGQEGCGKSHVLHTMPEPIAYIDTEGKADELAEKFRDKEVYYFQPNNYQDAKSALEQAYNVLGAYYEEGVRGSIAVDSLTVMWEWAQADYQQLAYPSADGPEEVDFKSALQGENDWMQIKRRHNKNFRDDIIQSPYHVGFSATASEDYEASAFGGVGGKPMKPNGEKHNKYVVKDVVRLRTNEDGKTVADLHKAARTRYSFLGLEWPEWDSIYDAIDQLVEAEQSDEEVDVSSWPFAVVDGQPVQKQEDDDDD